MTKAQKNAIRIILDNTPYIMVYVEPGKLEINVITNIEDRQSLKALLSGTADLVVGENGDWQEHNVP